MHVEKIDELWEEYANHTQLYFNMELALATEEETLRFLNGLWYSWACRIVRIICQTQGLDEEQSDALQTVLLRGNDFSVICKPSLHE